MATDESFKFSESQAKSRVDQRHSLNNPIREDLDTEIVEEEEWSQDFDKHAKEEQKESKFVPQE